MLLQVGYAATDEFQLVVIVSNGLGNGQSVTFPTSGEHVRFTGTFQGSVYIWVIPESRF